MVRRKEAVSFVSLDVQTRARLFRPSKPPDFVTGWLGGELVDRLGVGVDDGANLDAPSSLSGPAR
jgi:hypothetical protein